MIDMETLIHVIDAMLNRAFCATMNEHLMFRIFFYGFIIAMLVIAISAVKLGVQFIIKKARK